MYGRVVRIHFIALPLAFALVPALHACRKPATQPAAVAASRSAEPLASTPAPSPARRTPAVRADDPQYARLEGARYKNDCDADSDCGIGGCSMEMCSAEPGRPAICEDGVDGARWGVEDGLPRGEGASCGCVAGQCVWYRLDEVGRPEK
jgi:hypothetical protein